MRRAALARRRRVRLRPGRALHAVRQERPGRRSVERGRRHQQRAGLQEHPLLPDQPRLRRLRQPPGEGRRSRSRSEKVERVQFSVPGESLDYFLIYGPTPKEVLEPLHRAHRPPRAAAGLVVRAVADHLVHHQLRRGDRHQLHPGHGRPRSAAARLPLRLLLDEGVPLVQLRVGPARASPIPRRCWRGSRRAGCASASGSTPTSPSARRSSTRGWQHGYLVKRPNGDVWQWDQLAGRAWALVDFTNPDACALVRRQAARAGRHGRGLLQDRLRRAHPDRRGLLRRLRPAQDAQLLHATCTTRPSSRCWRRSWARARRSSSPARPRPAASSSPSTGAATRTATFESMAESLRGGLSLGLSGFGFWSHDIGGFEQTALAGRLQALVRLRAALLAQPPARQQLLPRALAVRRARRVRRAALLHQAQVPADALSLRRGAPRRTHAGIPVMRAMLLEFPDDPACDTLDRQYMLGDCAAGRAGLHAGRRRWTTTCPPGRWTHFLTGQVVEGGRWVRERHGYLSLPLLARPNSIIAGRRERRPPRLRLRRRRDVPRLRAPGRRNLNLPACRRSRARPP